jgi:hypothetical protein
MKGMVAVGLIIGLTSPGFAKRAAKPRTVLPPGVRLAKRTTAETPADLGVGGRYSTWRQLSGKDPNFTGYRVRSITVTPDQFVGLWTRKGANTIAQVDDGGPGPYFVAVPKK